jgi:hypothetical protein
MNFLNIYEHVYTCVCVCVCMYACILTVDESEGLSVGKGVYLKATTSFPVVCVDGFMVVV